MPTLVEERKKAIVSTALRTLGKEVLQLVKFSLCLLLYQAAHITCAFLSHYAQGTSAFQDNSVIFTSIFILGVAMMANSEEIYWMPNPDIKVKTSWTAHIVQILWNVNACFLMRCVTLPQVLFVQYEKLLYSVPLRIQLAPYSHKPEEQIRNVTVDFKWEEFVTTTFSQRLETLTCLLFIACSFYMSFRLCWCMGLFLWHKILLPFLLMYDREFGNTSDLTVHDLLGGFYFGNDFLRRYHIDDDGMIDSDEHDDEGDDDDFGFMFGDNAEMNRVRRNLLRGRMTRG